MNLAIKNQKLFWSLNIILFAEWLFLAFGVLDRNTWLMENVLSFVFIGPVIYLYLKHVLSDRSYALIVFFLIVHTLGAHYTYSKVPYEIWSIGWFDQSINQIMGWERNHYDRLVHFLFGVVLTLPLIEYFKVKSPLRGIWLISFVLLLSAAASTAYELIEWAAAAVFGEGLGNAYLGTQGDEFDAQKDIALATIGSFIGLLFVPKSKTN